MAKQSEAAFHIMQQDLVGRSKYGELREATKSGHYIQRDQPELVIQAIKGRHAKECDGAQSIECVVGESPYHKKSIAESVTTPVGNSYEQILHLTGVS